MVNFTYEEAAALAASAGTARVPLAREIMSDAYTPVNVLRMLRNVSDHCFLLESVAGESREWGRYSFLGYQPKLGLTCVNGHLEAGALKIDTSRPDDYIRQLLDAYRLPRVDGLPPFTGGLVGYFSYDYLKYAEPTLCLDAEDTEGFKDVDLMLFDKVIVFDNYKQKILLIVDADLGEGEAGYRKALRDLDEMERLLEGGEMAADEPGHLTTPAHELFDETSYCNMVRTAQRHIHEGDIFQVVLSNRLEAGYEGTLLNAYRTLRTINPSPYLFYFTGTDVEVAGASPETLVKLENGVLHTFPLAGTRPRGATPAEDDAAEAELLADPKELAEHNMLVDLGRNDLGRLSKFGTVEVERYHEVLRYSHVMHIGSTVRGEIRDDLDALDCIDAVLPAGTLSGAPKLAACQLINDLEGNKRGIYGGAVGYLSFTGDLDVCIGIRLAYKKNGRVFVRSGAGIVADSVPECEYRECINKAAAMVAALDEAEALR